MSNMKTVEIDTKDPDKTVDEVTRLMEEEREKRKKRKKRKKKSKKASASAIRYRQLRGDLTASALFNTISPATWAKSAGYEDGLREVLPELADFCMSTGQFGKLAYQINARMHGRVFTEKVAADDVDAMRDVIKRGVAMDKRLKTFASAFIKIEKQAATKRDETIVDMMVDNALSILPSDSVNLQIGLIKKEAAACRLARDVDEIPMGGVMRKIASKDEALDVLTDALDKEAADSLATQLSLGRHPDIRRSLLCSAFSEVGSVGVFENNQKLAAKAWPSVEISGPPPKNGLSGTLRRARRCPTTFNSIGC